MKYAQNSHQLSYCSPNLTVCEMIARRLKIIVLHSVGRTTYRGLHIGDVNCPLVSSDFNHNCIFRGILMIVSSVKFNHNSFRSPWIVSHENRADGEMKEAFLPLFRVKFARNSFMLIKILTTSDSVL